MKFIKRLFGRPSAANLALTPDMSIKEVELTRLAREYLAGEGDLAIFENYKNGTKSLDFLTGLKAAEIPSRESRLETPRYPQYSEGIPVTELEEIIASQRPLIAKIYNASEMSKEDFLALIVPIVWNFAALVHLLPASQGNHHSGPGGAFRHGLEVAYLAMKSSYDKYIPTSVVAPRFRSHVLKQWYLAIFIAAIGHDLGKLLTDFHVVAAKDDPAPTWNPFTSSLYDWAVKNKLERYYLIWVSRRYRRHEGKGPALLPMLVSRDHLDWIMQHTREPFEAMMACLTAPNPANNLIANVVLDADARSSEADARARVQNEGDPGVIMEQGERIIIAAIRRLWRQNKWRINEPGGRLWIPDDTTVYVIWDAATKDITEDLKRHAGRSLLPDEPEALASLMVESGAARAFVYQGHEHLLHSIRIPAMASEQNPGGPLYYALKADLNAVLGIVTSPSYSAVVEVSPDGNSIGGPNTSAMAPHQEQEAASSEDATTEPSQQNSEAQPEADKTPGLQGGAEPSIRHGKTDTDDDQVMPRPEPKSEQNQEPASSKPPTRAPRKGKRFLQWPGDRFISFDQLRVDDDSLLIPVELAESAFGAQGSELLDKLKADGLIDMKPRRQTTPLIVIDGERFFLLHEPLIVKKELKDKETVQTHAKRPKERKKRQPEKKPSPSASPASNHGQGSVSKLERAPGNGVDGEGKKGDSSNRKPPLSPEKKPGRQSVMDSLLSQHKTSSSGESMPDQSSQESRSRNDPDEEPASRKVREPSGDDTPYEFYRRELWLRFMESCQEAKSDLISMDLLAEQVAWLSERFGITYTRPRLLNRIADDNQFYKSTPEGLFIRR